MGKVRERTRIKAEILWETACKSVESLSISLVNKTCQGAEVSGGGHLSAMTSADKLWVHSGAQDRPGLVQVLECGCREEHTANTRYCDLSNGLIRNSLSFSFGFMLGL